MYLQRQGHLFTGVEALDIDLRDSTIVDMGIGSFLYASTGTQGGVTAYALDGAGGLATLVDQQSFDSHSAHVAAGVVEVIEVDGAYQLIFGSTPGDALIGYELNSDRTISGLNEIAPLTGTAGQIGGLATTDTGSGTRVYVIDNAAGTLSTHSLSGAGTQQGGTASLQTSSISFGTGAQIDTVDIGGASYLLATDQNDNAVSSYAISGNASALTQVSTLGAKQGLGINTPTAMEVVTAFGKTWVILGSAGSGSLSVMMLSDDGRLAPVDHVLDTRHTRFDDVTSIAVAQDGDRVFVVAGGSDDGLSVFTLAPDGRLIHLQTIIHTDGSGMENIGGLTATLIGEHIQVFASSGVTGGLTQFGINLRDVTDAQRASDGGQTLSGGAGQDMLVGSDIGYDILAGAAGDDLLIAGAAGAQLTGGQGLDRFILNADAAYTLITDFASGVDQIDMSDFPFLLSANQLSITPTVAGARITFRDAIIDVRSHNGTALDSGDLFPNGFTGPDRVLVLSREIDESLTGTPGDDTLSGVDGDDTITGLGGDDSLDGGTGNDSLVGGAGNDTMLGGDGADALWSGEGHDLITGGNGDDSLGGSGGNDTLQGNAGQDEVWGGGGNDHVYGGSDDDTVGGGSGNDLVSGEGGNDQMWGGWGSDTLDGGSGDDEIGGREGHDLIFGGEGNDTVWAEVGDDQVGGGDGDDLLAGADGNDTLLGDGGTDDLRGGGGSDSLVGGLGDDSLSGGDGADTLWGGAGNDYLDGQNGDDLLGGADGADTLIGGSGNDAAWANGGADILWGGWGNDTLGGGEGHDTLQGEDGNDALWGGWGNDYISGGLGNDIMSGRDGADTLLGNDGNDELWADDGDDRLWGGADNDTLGGGAGNDVLYGEAGTDELRGGSGNDVLWGNSGADSFIFFGNQGNDRIMDFTTGEDVVTIADTVFTFNTLPKSQTDGDVTIFLGSGRIVLEGINLIDLRADDLLFV